MRTVTRKKNVDAKAPPYIRGRARFASPLVHAAERVGDRWVLLLIEALLQGPRRFGELQDTVEGIAPNILSNRLKQLERDSVVIARPYQQRPPRFAYELTASGYELAGALRLLAQWGATEGDGDTIRHRACGTPAEARWYCPTCAMVLSDEETDEQIIV
jgi:DNA-binding HxlR family transcriptional regulator